MVVLMDSMRHPAPLAASHTCRARNPDTPAEKRPRAPASPSPVLDSVASSSLLGESCSVPWPFRA